MLISHRNKSAFFHNPKTGGTSVAAALNLGRQSDAFPAIHMTVDEAKSCFFHETWDEYYTFAFVRNPWDRAVSLYHYHRSVQYAIFMRSNSSHVAARDYSFEDWLELNFSGVLNSNWFRQPQAAWYDGVSEVFRFEEFSDSIKVLAGKFSLNLTVPHLNPSVRSGYEDYYKTDRSIQIIEHIDAHVIRIFGYVFGQ